MTRKLKSENHPLLLHPLVVGVAKEILKSQISHPKRWLVCGGGEELCKDESLRACTWTSHEVKAPLCPLVC